MRAEERGVGVRVKATRKTFAFTLHWLRHPWRVWSRGMAWMDSTPRLSCWVENKLQGPGTNVEAERLALRLTVMEGKEEGG